MAEEMGRRNAETTGRVADLRMLLARLEGLEQDEIASLLGVEPGRLTAWVHQSETIPATKGEKIARVLRMVDDLDKVIERHGTARWFRLPIPALGDRTPIEALARGEQDRVEALVRSYLDPSYS